LVDLELKNSLITKIKKARLERLKAITIGIEKVNESYFNPSVKFKITIEPSL